MMSIMKSVRLIVAIGGWPFTDFCPTGFVVASCTVCFTFLFYLSRLHQLALSILAAPLPLFHKDAPEVNGNRPPSLSGGRT
jgi:hypothetical protein